MGFCQVCQRSCIPCNLQHPKGSLGFFPEALTGAPGSFRNQNAKAEWLVCHAPERLVSRGWELRLPACKPSTFGASPACKGCLRFLLYFSSLHVCSLFVSCCMFPSPFIWLSSPRFPSFTLSSALLALALPCKRIFGSDGYLCWLQALPSYSFVCRGVVSSPGCL